MKKLIAVAPILIALVLPSSSAELPGTTFFDGNAVYDNCKHNRSMAFGYTAGLYDEAAHGASVIDAMRIYPETKTSGIGVNMALDRIVKYCKPEGVTLEQMTDVFCNHLRDNPASRNGLPSILFNDALTKAWPCSKK